jgi:hypothetical protein
MLFESGTEGVDILEPLEMLFQPGAEGVHSFVWKDWKLTEDNLPFGENAINSLHVRLNAKEGMMWEWHE